MITGTLSRKEWMIATQGAVTPLASEMSWNDRQNSDLIAVNNIYRRISREYDFYDASVVHFEAKHKQQSSWQFYYAFSSALFAFFSATSATTLVSQLVEEMGGHITEQNVADIMQIIVGVLSLYLTYFNSRIKNENCQKWIGKYAEIRTNYRNIMFWLESEMHFPRTSARQLMKKVKDIQIELAKEYQKAKAHIPAHIEMRANGKAIREMWGTTLGTESSATVAKSRDSVVDLGHLREMEIEKIREVLTKKGPTERCDEFLVNCLQWLPDCLCCSLIKWKIIERGVEKAKRSAATDLVSKITKTESPSQNMQKRTRELKPGRFPLRRATTQSPCRLI